MGRVHWVDALAWLLNCLALAHNAAMLAKIAWSYRWMSANRALPLRDRATSRVVLLLPMFGEQSIAVEALEHFSRLDYPSELYRIVAITTPREPKTGGLSTESVVDSAIAAGRLDVVEHFKCDGLDVSKADQMNQAVRWIETERPQWWADDVLVGVYDADSRPEVTSLRDLDSSAARYPEASAFQQPAMYISKFDDLPGGLRGAYLRSRPLYNLRFCLGRELPGYLASIYVRQSSRSTMVKSFLSSPNHFLGHGEFMRVSALRSVGGFPPPSADTSLGTVLSFSGAAIVPLSTFDLGETPRSIGVLIRQGATWYAGCTLYCRDAKLAFQRGAEANLAMFVMIVKRWFENMVWLAGPVLHFAAVVWAAYRREPLLFAAGSAAVALHLISVVYVFRICRQFAGSLRLPDSLPKPHFTGSWSQVVMYPLMLVGTCLGPTLHYFYKAKSLVTRRPLPRAKTPR